MIDVGASGEEEREAVPEWSEVRSEGGWEFLGRDVRAR